VSSHTRYPLVTAAEGIVASAHYLASQAGVWMLQRGGNAVDAAVCAAATIAVVCPNLNGVGSDLFAQVWEPGAALPVGLNASGRSGSLATIDFIRSFNHDVMPERGALSANVPGAVSGWQALLERFGTRRLYDVLEPAIRYAENGAPVTAGIARGLAASQRFLQSDSGFREVFWPADTLLHEGEIFVNRQLGQTLREIGRTDGETVYRGAIAELMARGIQECGGHITLSDLGGHRADWIEPVSVEFHGMDVFELPPNSQGIAALEMLNLCELVGASALAPNSPAYVDALCSVIRLAIEDRDHFITDPTFTAAPVQRLISKAHAQQRVGDSRSLPADAKDGDTIYLCTADSDGMMVSLIQSQYRGFGSGLMVPGTGIHLNNRASYFSLDQNHINRIEPRKRTMHTLMPGSAGLDGRCELVFGTMGGDAQPQIHLQVLMNHLVFGMDVQATIEAPRFVWTPINGNSRSVAVEARMPETTVRGLRDRGYSVEVLEPWSSQMGHAQAIRIDHRAGTLQGAADPRGDGLALGY
jgi:gamma-glutamyltranspeptidase